ncbi:hypothetical protein GLW00_20020 [Halobacillus litoralis]|uniref:Uncharacterized protein n=1 Tax=Halobacillus litoralis TaxID=45668 RepID=A0A845FHX6_9BACI|nr:hypothetical protein [Halobacillus litoralis]MYL73107.1 hypothetical protein [Halobacillus litoralis]
MSILGNIAIVLSAILFVIDLFIIDDLLIYWGTLVLINQCTVGYRYYFKEGRKIWGTILMGTIAVAFIFIAIILVT